MKDFRSKLYNLKTPIIIGIAGDSGSGKTTYSNGIRRLLGPDLVKTITMDGYHKENRHEREISGILPLDPSANRLFLFRDHLAIIKKGKPVEIPTYNHQTGEFGKPVTFKLTPIVIIEGLHALYPEFLPFIDFAVFVDPSREVKWKWKCERDINIRGHDKYELTSEMLKREAAYKRWIDFQKTDADVVIKIYPSHMMDFARHELIKEQDNGCYKVELIMKTTDVKLSDLYIHFDLKDIFGINQSPFLLATAPSLYWGKKVTVVHIDGVLSEKTIKDLEKNIVKHTGIPVDKMLQDKHVSAVQFAQLLIAWRFLELISNRSVK